MALADRLSTPPARKPRGCTLCVALGTMTEAERIAVLAALVDEQWTDPALLAELRAEGYAEVVLSSLKYHRSSHLKVGA